MITDVAKEKIALFLKNFYNKANVGTGGNASFSNATTLDSPILGSNESTTNSLSNSRTIDFAVSITGGNLQGNVIRELGIFSENMPTNDAEFGVMVTEGVQPATSDGTEAATETNMLSRVVFDAIGPFDSNDTLNFTYTIEVE